MRSYRYKRLLTLCFSLGIFFSAEAQERRNVECCPTPVCAEDRLNVRLEKLLSLQKLNNYEELYELMTPRKAYTKDSFVKDNEAFDKLGRAQLQSFTPYTMGIIEPGRDFAVVIGCAEYLEKGKKKAIESKVEATYEVGDWFFHSLIRINAGFGSKGKKCSAGASLRSGAIPVPTLDRSIGGKSARAVVQPVASTQRF